MKPTVETKPRQTLTLKRKPLPSVTPHDGDKQSSEQGVERPILKRKVITSKVIEPVVPTTSKPITTDTKPAKPPKPKDPRKDTDFVGYIPTKKQRSAMRRMVTEERKAKHQQYMETSSAQGYTDRKRINATMRRLYPVWNECKPLAKNAQKAILDAIKTALPDVPNKAAKEAIGWHTQSRRYLENVAKGGARYTLDGIEQGEVLPYELEHTLAILAKYQARSEHMKGAIAK